MTAYAQTLATLSTPELKEIWNHTETMHTAEIPTVRGWILDEFEKRDADGFDSFLISNDLNDIN